MLNVLCVNHFLDFLKNFLKTVNHDSADISLNISLVKPPTVPRGSKRTVFPSGLKSCLKEVHSASLPLIWLKLDEEYLLSCTRKINAT